MQKYYTKESILALDLQKLALTFLKNRMVTNCFCTHGRWRWRNNFYLVAAVLILLFRKPKYLLAVMMAILLVTCISRYVVWTYKVEDLAYSSLYTFTRIDGLCIGSMVALFQKWIRSSWKNTLIILLLMAAVNFGFFLLIHQSGFTLPTGFRRLPPLLYHSVCLVWAVAGEIENYPGII